MNFEGHVGLNFKFFWGGWAASGVTEHFHHIYLMDFKKTNAGDPKANLRPEVVGAQ